MRPDSTWISLRMSVRLTGWARISEPKVPGPGIVSRELAVGRKILWISGENCDFLRVHFARVAQW